MDRLSVTIEPGVPVPELSDSETPCPLAWFVIRPTRMAQIATRTKQLNNQRRFL
jgi:hypothetical protein